MKRTLIVVDMQNDFIDGALGTPEAQAIVPAVKAKLQACRDRGDEIIFTRDTHGEDYLSTPEGKKLPVVHCVQGTQGWELALGLWQDGETIINKPTFGYTGWSEMKFEQVELVGLCTDICVVSNALILKALYGMYRQMPKHIACHVIAAMALLLVTLTNVSAIIAILLCAASGLIYSLLNERRCGK